MSSGHMRVAVVGNVDAGKSTLIGTLKSSTLDDGDGLNRTLVARHKHEVDTGRTSAISSHLIGFHADGTVVTSRASRRPEASIAEASHKTVSLMDLAGHEKYLKTTVSGLARGMADYALVLVNAAQAPTHMTMHHINLCSSCGIPFIVVLTKVDSCPGQVFRNTQRRTVEALKLPEIQKKPFAVKTVNDIAVVKDKMQALVPVLVTSCVTGEGLDLLRHLIFALPKRRQHQNKVNRPFEFLIDSTFSVQGVGFVVSGFVNAGSWTKGQTLLLGPMSGGQYIKTTVKSVHVAQTDVDAVWAGHSACFALALPKEKRKLVANLSRGYVLVKEPIPAVHSFQTDMYLRKGASVTMAVGRYQSMIHILHSKRVVKLVAAESIGPTTDSSVKTAVVRPGVRARLTFAFTQGPAYVRPGMRVILHVRGVGFVTSVNGAS